MSSHHNTAAAQVTRRRLLTIGIAVGLTLAACGADERPTDEALAITTPTTTVPSSTTTIPSSTTTLAPATTATTTTAATATTTTAATTTTTAVLSDAALAGAPAVAEPVTVDDVADRVGEQIELMTPVFDIGYSVEGRPIVAERLGKAGGRKVLVIGVIHGNEDAGVQITDELRRRAIADDVELWLVESMNPDGQARQDRHNANEVDLNRNFPYKWGPIGGPGNSQYAGTGPASEPETQALVQFITLLRPDIAIWYHQDANLIIPSTGRDGRIRARYAELTALPLADCCGGGVYTGVAGTWARNELKKTSDAVPFIVELPGGVLSGAQVQAHATAVLTIASEG